ncbi:MAG: hypothetical protein A3D31_09565 [Candidatus Fluviicola riflensis]|nr:MAG: hypothetical protein CHH17_13975 [Candidatus Fluviicola riflensis]OGS77254.1 MAG: hypothetical protein A3D31_09565 [Candidatus Fluviicola riflensis]OGS82189.1 MAG: hypothetical protein A2724_18510 [Fluviicola sp. RIFCSPHIGHO2_01_FULL_43_53]OGS87882.1 MAG: hypothetical protein A3E30_15945 [Fluviicola sp. RIFCSPHIGHO2_12_FULL_43_24]
MNCVELLATKKGKGLIAFSDPAGAKACLALHWILTNIHGLDAIRLVSNKSYSFYADWNTEVTIIDDPSAIDLSDLDWLFTGTSHPDSSHSFEVTLLKQANEQHIFTASFIDHWTNLSERFSLNSTFVFPDVIFVIDPQLIQHGSEAGIPSEKLMVSENPYLQYIRLYWKSQLSIEQFRKTYNIPESATIILTYAPDPISLRHELSDFGFNEFTVLGELLQLLHQHPEVFLIIKTHPLQPLEQLNLLIEDAKSQRLVLETANRIDNLELIFHSTAIIGFLSNFLWEASALRKPVYRYALTGNDAYYEQFKSVTTRFSSLEELKNCLSL